VNVAVFGGSFNPPHVAHVLACALLLSVEDVERVLLVPTYRHPLAKSLAAFEDRVLMCELAMIDLPRVEVSRVEQSIDGESLTLRTLERLAETRPDWRLRLVVGADVLAEAQRWYRFDAIEKLAPLIVLGRVGFDTPRAPLVILPDVSSTHVRTAVARGAWNEVERIVPRLVVAHIRARRLYGAAT
jgi:nicotinate-nucleotide adenylyltransferase